MPSRSAQPAPEPPSPEVLAAIERLPRGQFVLTATHETRHAGVIVRGVQPCADVPPMLIVAVRKGNAVSSLIRDARCFAICQIDPADRLLLRKFIDPPARGRDADPFDCFGIERLATGSPVFVRTPLAFDCELSRHFDLESDHEVYVGLIRAVKIGASAESQPQTG